MPVAQVILSKSESDRRILKLYTDVYEGDGVENPPIVTRLDRIEQLMSRIDKLTWAVVLAIVSTIVDMISHHIR